MYTITENVCLTNNTHGLKVGHVVDRMNFTNNIVVSTDDPRINGEKEGGSLTVLTYAVLAYTVLTYTVLTYTVLAYTVLTYTVPTYTVLTHTALTNTAGKKGDPLTTVPFQIGAMMRDNTMVYTHNIHVQLPPTESAYGHATTSSTDSTAISNTDSTAISTADSTAISTANSTTNSTAKLVAWMVSNYCPRGRMDTVPPPTTVDFNVYFSGATPGARVVVCPIYDSKKKEVVSNFTAWTHVAGLDVHSLFDQDPMLDTSSLATTKRGVHVRSGSPALALGFHNFQYGPRVSPEAKMP
jgi:hypothetical protein